MTFIETSFRMASRDSFEKIQVKTSYKLIWDRKNKLYSIIRITYKVYIYIFFLKENDNLHKSDIKLIDQFAVIFEY